MNTNFPRQNEGVSAGSSREKSIISSGTSFKGEILTPNDIQVDGIFEGKIISQSKIIVGENARIKGDMICNNCEFSGRIEGNLFVKDTLSLTGTAVINGDLHIKRLQVALDAKFNGTCHMISEEDFSRLTGMGKPVPQNETKPLSHSAPQEQTRPAAGVQPAQSTQSAQPAQPTQSAQPAAHPANPAGPAATTPQSRFSVNPFGERRKPTFPEA